MREYHKIHSVWKRDSKGRFTDEFSTKEIGFLHSCQWVGTEKVDGMNIRIGKEYGKISIAGKTDRAQILPELYEVLLVIGKLADKHIDAKDFILFGEGYGNKIQKAGKNYISDNVDFILFDVFIGGYWLKREDVDQIAKDIHVKSVPVVWSGNITQAAHFVSDGFDSTLADAKAEGLVLEPKTQLYTRTGHRIITKLKTKDFNNDLR
jgi:hypothetical protein